jgi:type IV pilus biogenesis/stability protein PilW
MTEKRRHEMKSLTITSVFGILLAVVFMTGGCAPSQEVVQPKEAAYHNTMGRAYLQEGKVQLAFVEFQKAIKMEPNNKEVVYNLGYVYFQLEDYINARHYFLKAVNLDPQYADAYNNLGATYMQLRQWKEAVDAFQKALANPFYKTPESAFCNLGISYYRLGEYDKAVDAFKDAIRRDKSFSLPYYVMALAYNKLERFGDAADVMDRAIEIDPGYQGNRDKKITDIKERLYSAKGEEEADLKDYLEIMNY